MFGWEASVQFTMVYLLSRDAWSARTRRGYERVLVRLRRQARKAAMFENPNEAPACLPS